MSDNRGVRLNSFLTAAIFSTLFFSSYVLFTKPFEGYLSYMVVLLLLPLFFLKYRIPVNILMLYALLLLFGIVNILSGDNTGDLFMKIFLNIVISSLFYYYIFQVFNCDIDRILGLYMKGAAFVALIGLIQMISYKVGFKAGYDFRWIFNKWSLVEGGIIGIRLNSIFSEPSYFGASIGPAFFIAAYNLTKKRNLYISKWQNIIILVTYFLTSSSVAYLGIFATLVVLLINFGFVRYVMIFVPLIITSYIYLYNNNSDFRERVDGVDNLYSGNATTAFEVHGSSFVQYNNFHVATENFKRNPLYGSGLGSHSIAYDKYSLTKAYGGIYDFNKADANSMALRLMSETGLFGMLFILIFILKFFTLRDKVNDSNEVYWLASGAALVIIVLQLFRQGNYTYNGFFFYMWLYYYANIKNKEKSIKETAKTVAHLNKG